jgi:hypothetical protein
MRVVAIKTVQGGHDIPCHEILMASQAAFIGYHFGGFFAVAVAVETGQTLHTHAMDQFVDMASRTCLLIWSKSMQVSEMALTATDILHKNVPGMSV